MDEHCIEHLFIRQEAQSAFERVWETAIRVPFTACTEELGFSDSQSEWMGAVAWIGGAWTGNVQIVAPPDFAQQITRALFAPAHVFGGGVTFNETEVNDALRELANMVAGNLKSCLPGVCGLATPGNFKISNISALGVDFPPLLQRRYSTACGDIVLTVSEL